MNTRKFLNFKGLQIVISQIKSYIDERVAQIVGSAPEALDTLNELANALGQDENFATTVTNLISQKANQDELDNIHSKINQLANMFYPIGSIYMSVTEIDPQQMFGGTWMPLENQFLIGASEQYEAGSMGGESEHILLEGEMPLHNHTVALTSSGGHAHQIGTDRDTSYTYSGDCWSVHNASSGASYLNGYTSTAGNHTHGVTVASSGESKAHNNMPPYLAVYMWKRIA